ncbi:MULTISPECIES: hypothetical protein [unclassified Ruegeria]|uniref:hypothetical protein n=1 Tax=unclassified Ruegeria TaxID=2625375 RepID=UPI0014887212|nr:MULTISPECIES: hypothetical protein [unclassified Ruegeria]
MFRLASVLYSLIATAFAGSAVIAVLSAGFVTTVAIISAALVGGLLALPAAWFVARRLYTSQA